MNKLLIAQASVTALVLYDPDRTYLIFIAH
jgi:hypothetical protein